MHDVIVFVLYVRPLNQMINPFNLAAGLSLEVGPDPWPMVSLPPPTSWSSCTGRFTGSLGSAGVELRRVY